MKGEFDLDNNHLQQARRKILRVSIGQVTPGYVTARDIYSNNNQLILTKDVKLEPHMIAKLMFYGIKSIEVYRLEETPKSKKSYYEKIRESEEFINFHSIYKEVLDNIVIHFNQTISQKENLDQDALVKELKKIFGHTQGHYHLLELLYALNECDNMTLVHSINVSVICNLFGQWLHMSEQDIDVLTLCGLMHDVGKISMPKEILNKPGKLTEDEFSIIKGHTVQGYHILSTQKIDSRIRLAALEHHERFDGSGYPLAKKGDKIHPFSMITAIADVFDAMTSNRVYRGAICPFSVLEMFEHEGKNQYDLRVSMPLMERIAEIYINHTVRLNTDVQGEVILLNQHALSQPVIRVGEEFIDLSKHNNLRIKAVV